MLINKNEIKSVKVIYDNINPVFKKEEEALRDNLWEELVKRNPKVFNGEHFGCSGVVKNNDKIMMNITRTNYKNNVYVISSKNFIQGAHVAAVRVILYDEKYIYLVRRTSNTAVHKNKITLVSGNFDYSQIPADKFIDKSYEVVQTEIEEETKIRKIKKKDIQLESIVFSEPESRLVFNFLLFAKLEDLNGIENREIIKVDRMKIKSFIKENEESIISGSNLREFLLEFSL